MNPNRLARVAGLFYLGQLVLSGFSQLYVRPSVFVAGNATATADNVRASATLFRIGLVTDLAGLTCFLLVGIALFILLRSVGDRAGLAMVLFVAVGVAIGSADLINHAGALLVATDASYSTGLGTGAADALVLLFLNLYRAGYFVAQVFYALWLLPAGYLVYRSGWFPRGLGVLVAIGCFSSLAELVVVFSSPTFVESDLAVLVLMPAAIAELTFMLWLAIKGAKTREVA
jgi:hypothetical protein